MGFPCSYDVPQHQLHFIHSLIYIEHILYSASSRKLLRSAHNTNTIKQSSLKVRKNAGEKVLLKMLSSEGRPFQVEGPTTEKARICLVEVDPIGKRDQKKTLLG